MVFYVDETGYVRVEFTKNNQPVVPNSVTITVYNPQGNKTVDNVVMNNEGSGVYTYYVDFNMAGKWLVHLEATDTQGHKWIEEKEVFVHLGGGQ